MEKLLISLLVLGMAVAANAMTLQISVEGDLDPVDSDITVMPSDTLMLNIHSPDGYAGLQDDVYFFLIADSTYGYLSGGVVTAEAPCDTWLYPDAIILHQIWPPPIEGVSGMIGCAAGTPAPAGIYIDEVMFHCEALGDVTVDLWSTPDFATFNVEDTVTIHQIPEPGTVLLLSLGGLALLRKRRS